MELVAYRSADWDTPWWDRPNRAAGRFNRVLDPPTQYISLHPLGPFAERLRGLGRGVLADVDTIAWRSWAVRVLDDDLVPITFDSAARHGLTPDELIADDWTSCQDMADRLRAAGTPGIIVPSAALPGSENIVLFGPKVASPYLLAPIDPDVDVPTAHSAERSAAPLEILGLIRWHGEPHPGLESWKAGGIYRFSDPVAPRP